MDGWRHAESNPLGNTGFFCGKKACLKDCTYMDKGKLKKGGEACPASHPVVVNNSRHPDWACTLNDTCRDIFNAASRTR